MTIIIEDLKFFSLNLDRDINQASSKQMTDYPFSLSVNFDMKSYYGDI